MVIRQATIGDLQSILTLNTALFETESSRGHDDNLDLNWPKDKRGEDYFRLALTAPESAAFVAIENDTAIGYILGNSKNKFSYRKEKTGELENMYVVTEYRHKGVGKALVEYLFVWFKTNGIRRVYVSAYAKNDEAIRFYDACGFELIEVGLEAKI